MLKDFWNSSAVKLTTNSGVTKDHIKPHHGITTKRQRQIYKQNPEKSPEILFLVFNPRQKKSYKRNVISPISQLTVVLSVLMFHFAVSQLSKTRNWGRLSVTRLLNF